MTQAPLAQAGRPRGRLSVAVSLLLAAVLLYLAVPRTIAAFLERPEDSTLLMLQFGGPVSVAELERLIASQERALEWHESGRLYTDLGLAKLVLATELAGDDDIDPGRMVEVIRLLRTGLTKAPARPHAWTRLASAELITRGPSPEVAVALEMALLTAPYDPRLLFARLELCLIAWSELSPTTRDLVYRQVRFAWNRSRDRLVELAVISNADDIVRIALSGSPDDLAEFEERLGQGRS